jgi:TonB family protein
MTRIFASSFLIAMFFMAFVSNETHIVLSTIDSNNLSNLHQEDSVYTEVDTEPDFVGGEQAMSKFILANILYPESAVRNGEQGKVYVMFVVGRDGVLRDFSIARGVSQTLDAEALRVVKLMPKWTPGYYQGNPVSTKVVIPINFKLNGKPKKNKKR